MVTFLLASAILSALFLAVAALERVPALRFRPARFRRPHLLTDAAWYGVATGAAAVATFVVRPLVAPAELPLTADRLDAMPLALVVVLAVVVYDLVEFAVHVALHRSDSLWLVHKVHHSSRHLDWLATTRTHMFEHMVRNLPGQVALLVLGFPAGVVTAALAVYAAFALAGHSNLGIGLRRLEWLFVTPRIHRRHHVPATTQRNFGTVLSLWDRMLGTLVRVDTAGDEPFGVPGELDTFPQRFAAAAREPLRQRRSRVAGAVAPSAGS